MRKERLLASALLLVLFLLSCAKPVAPTPLGQASQAKGAAPASAPVAAPAASTTAAWQEKWDKTISEAKKEGRFVLYIGLGGEPRRILTSAFENKYGVRIESVTGSTSSLVPKIDAEQRAGIYSGDVWIGGSTSYRDSPGLFDALEPVLILPEFSDPELIKKTWYFGEIPWANKARTMLIGCIDNQLNVVMNRDLVKPGEIKTYRDLLDPKWKGKMSLMDPRVSGSGNMWFCVMMETGDGDEKYMRDLLTQDLFITRDRRLQVEWLARGKNSIAIAPYISTVTEFIDLGSPLLESNPGTPFVSGSTSGIAIMKKAPHANAAKLFINWDMSQEGQVAHTRAVGIQSQRLDVPTSHLRPAKVLQPGLKVFRADNEEFAAKRTTVYTPLAQKIFGP